MPTKGQKALADKQARKSEKTVDKTVNLTDVSGSSKMSKKAKKVTTSSKRRSSARY